MAQCVPINIGEFRERIAFQQEVQTTDNMGGYTKTWSTVATVWAKIKPIRQNEREQAMTIGKERTHKIWIRFNSSLDNPAYRILWGTRTFNVVSILNIDEQDVLMEIHAVEFART